MGIMHIDKVSSEVEAGSLVYVPPNATQYLENTGSQDIAFLCIVDPFWRPEDEELIEQPAKQKRQAERKYSIH
jgi:mannose-6-phosphate isomerase-like protein (cupin superfamily)